MTSRLLKLNTPIVDINKVSPLEEGLIVYDRSSKTLNVSNGSTWVSLSGARDLEDERAISGAAIRKDITVNSIQATRMAATSSLTVPPATRALDNTPGSLYFDAASNNLIVTGVNGIPTTSVTIAASNNTIAIGGTPLAPTIGGNYVGGFGVSVAGNVISSTLNPTIFSTAFTTVTDESYTFSGAFVDQVVARFPYVGSSQSPISKFTLVLGFGAGTPTGNFKLVDQSTSNVIATLTYDGIVAESAIYTTNLISNVPSTASILNIVLNAGGVAPAILLYSALIN